MATLRQMNEDGHTVIIITHAPELAESADRVIEISDGLIVADRIPGNVRRIGRAKPVLAARKPGKAAIITDVAAAVRMSFRALRANLFRTILTLLGIVIGVSSVVAMLAIGTGAQDSVLSRIAAMGSDLLVVRPNMSNFRGGEGGSIVSLIPSDADAILELPNISFAVPEMSSTLTVRARQSRYADDGQRHGAAIPAGQILDRRGRRLPRKDRHGRLCCQSPCSAAPLPMRCFPMAPIRSANIF